MRWWLVLVSCVSTACRSSSPIAAEDARPAASAAPGGLAPADRFVTEAEAVARVEKLPDVAELADQDFTAAHPDGIGRKMKPVVVIAERVERATCGRDCVYRLDVFDVAEKPTDVPTLTFHLDAQSSALEITLGSPYAGRMSYDRYRKLVDEQLLIQKRLFALPEIVALRKSLERVPIVPPCGKSQLGLVLGEVPSPTCARGPGCAFVYELRTPNGCVASLWATIEVDSPTGEMRVMGLGETGSVPYAKWSQQLKQRTQR
jgi:hypothetical protein